MFRIFAFITILMSGPVSAQLTIDLGQLFDDHHGAITLNGQGGVELSVRPRNRVIHAPYTITPNPTDQEMALQSVAIALTDKDPSMQYQWYNPLTGNHGEIILHTPVSRKCLRFEVILQLTGRSAQHEIMSACKGGGNSNTWIINRKWVMSSVDRTGMDRQKCKVRFTDPKIPGQPRAGSTLRVCRTGHTWTVKH